MPTIPGSQGLMVSGGKALICSLFPSSSHFSLSSGIISCSGGFTNNFFLVVVVVVGDSSGGGNYCRRRGRCSKDHQLNGQWREERHRMRGNEDGMQS